VEALAALWRLHRLRGRAPVEAPVALVAAPADARPGFLSEAVSLALLAAQGIAVGEHRLCADADAAVAAWRGMGAPVALKACSARLPHKSEHGLVALGINDEAALREALARQAQTLASLGVDDASWIVARMQRGQQELALGVRNDPVFGPVVMVGAGGKYVEALGDVALLMPPFAAEEALAALRGLRIGRLLAGVRGEPAADMQAVAEQAARLGCYALAAAGHVASIDINPVLVGAQGEGAVALDALVELSDGVSEAARRAA
jgi:hypothetical protein